MSKIRSIKTSIEIDAPVEFVWKALTEAEELTRWFPKEAKVTPGKDGSIFMSWGDGQFEGEVTIAVWEPLRNLKLTHPMSGGVEIAQDYTLESKNGKTVLRLVHSGFSENDSWDDQFDATKRGWNFELNGLKHYLENHRNINRDIIWVRKEGRQPFNEIWTSVLEASFEKPPLNVGDEFLFRASNSVEISGETKIYDPPFEFAGIAKNLNKGYFRIRIDKSCGSLMTPEINFFLSLYGVATDNQKHIENALYDLAEKF